ERLALREDRAGDGDAARPHPCRRRDRPPRLGTSRRGGGSRRPRRAGHLQPLTTTRQRRVHAHRPAAEGELRADHEPLRGRPRLTAACDKLAKAPIYVDDTGSINMVEIRSKARRLKSRHPDLGLVIVDYLQLMTSGGNAENRVQEVSQISRSLKILARDLDVPIVALSQLSRAVEQRTDKRPILSDLRESGSIEQDADLVAFTYRDEYYNDESDQQVPAEVILAKHRNGPTDAMKLSFLQRYAKFA